MSNINPRKEELRIQIEAFVAAGGDFFCGEIAEALGEDPRDVAAALTILRRRRRLDWEMVGSHYLYKAINADDLAEHLKEG